MAIAANMLGLNNAATPLGIKAMEELQTLNPDKDTATNPMVMFMALTTSGVQLIPATMIGVLAAAGSLNPTAIIATSLVATFAGTVAAVIAAKLLQRFYTQAPAAPAEVTIVIRAALEAISLWAIPVMLVVIPLVGPASANVKVYDVFIEGAKEGFDVAVKIIPFLVGILVAIGMFRGSGAMDLLTAALRPLMTATGFPAELIPLAILRSLTGSGSLAFTTDLDQDLRRRLAHRPHGGDDVRHRRRRRSTCWRCTSAPSASAARATRCRRRSSGDVVAAIAAVAVCAWMF